MREMQTLWYFTKVARAGGFTAAADRLGLSTAALSKSIAALERRMGVQLFTRTGRKLKLTEEGRKLLENVGGAFGTIEDSYQKVRSDTAEPAGIVRLSTVTAYGKHCVLPLLPRFFQRYPQIELVMSLHDGSRGMTRQEFDIRINWGEDKEKDKVSQLLCTMPLILVASPRYLAQRGSPRTLDDLAAHDCINVALPNGRRAHWTFLPRHGQRRDRVPVTMTPKGPLIVMDELDAVVDAAEAGLGITVSSAENVLKSLREGRLVRVLEGYDVGGHGEMHTQVIMQYPRKRQLPAKVRVLVDFLLKALKGRDPLEVVGGSTAVRSAP